MNKTNYSLVQKKKFKDLIINEKPLQKMNNNKNIIDIQFYNTISTIKKDENSFSNQSIIKHHTSINSIKKNEVKNNITNQKMIKKLKVKCKNNNEKINIIGKNGYFPETSNIIKYKKIYKNTPKLNNENNNRSFFSSSIINNKIKNRLKHFKVLDLNNNSVTINFDRTNSSERDYFSKYKKNDKNNKNNKNNKNIIKSQISRLKTEINMNNKNRLVIHRNTDNKKINKLKIIKESNTEKNDCFKNVNNNNLFILNNNSNEIKKDNNKTNKNSFSKIKKKNIINNYEEINVKKKSKPQIIKNINNNEIKKNILIDYNILCGCLSLNNINKNINNDSKLIFNAKKKITSTNDNSYIKMNPTKKLNKTINNINNFSNCNYIYLLNNGDKFIKIKKQFKA